MTDKQARLIESAQGKGTFERTSEEVFAVMYRNRPERFEAWVAGKEREAKMTRSEKFERDCAATERFFMAERLGVPHHGSTDERI